ncbi:MAG TPA: cysteine dioxygenase [Aliidongia sp.]|uniref:cysteine dioxygenase family protein n=1 Tax=Aliidongia sp. TaxID=1914230 RepID=UPI002DDD8DC4|nr:cysteine dioxygenase [Aliidongia sp.]HEV2674859.1 cysteine dioxygenase [Aliidongia sp.]
MSEGIERLRRCIAGFTRLVETAPDEPRALEEGARLLADLVAVDDWLPPECAVPDRERYQQYLLHCDPLERFSVVSFVWGPGQATPIHDHGVWGLIGMLRGAELSHDWDLAAGRRTGTTRLEPGMVAAVSPRIGDVHQVENAFGDRSSISIHVYGANIGAVARRVFRETGAAVPFVSGYTNATVPNLWDRSAAVRAGLPDRA